MVLLCRCFLVHSVQRNKNKFTACTSTGVLVGRFAAIRITAELKVLFRRFVIGPAFLVGLEQQERGARLPRLLVLATDRKELLVVLILFDPRRTPDLATTNFPLTSPVRMCALFLAIVVPDGYLIRIPHTFGTFLTTVIVMGE